MQREIEQELYQIRWVLVSILCLRCTWVSVPVTLDVPLEAVSILCLRCRAPKDYTFGSTVKIKFQFSV